VRHASSPRCTSNTLDEAVGEVVEAVGEAAQAVGEAAEVGVFLVVVVGIANLTLAAVETGEEGVAAVVVAVAATVIGNRISLGAVVTVDGGVDATVDGGVDEAAMVVVTNRSRV
jgi:hypothetical protein